MARFFRRGVSKIYFVPTVADTTPPRTVTSAEVTAGTNLTASVAELAGFNISNSPIATPDMDTIFTKSIVGEDTTDTSTLTFYDDDSATTIRAALAKGTTGNIVLMPYGNTATKRCEVWPVRSTGVNDEWTAGNEAARFVVGFAITDTPDQSGVIGS